MADVKIELNHNGIRVFLLSNAVKSILEAEAKNVQGRAGSGYTHDIHRMPGRLVSAVWTDSKIKDDDDLLRAIGK